MLWLFVHFLILSLMCSQFVASVGCAALGGVLCLGAMPPCATQFSFNALLLVFCWSAELLPTDIKQSSAVNRKLFVKTATKTDVALRAALAPDGLGHRPGAGSIPRINLQLPEDVITAVLRSFPGSCRDQRAASLYVNLSEGSLTPLSGISCGCSLLGRLFRCRGYPRHRAGCRPNAEPGSYWLEITSMSRQITCTTRRCEFFRGINPASACKSSLSCKTLQGSNM